jgi:PPOX class probable F420-dependent enzyme
MSLLTDDDIALLHEKQLAHVAVVLADGSPQVTPVWVDTDGEAIIFNTAKGRVKYNAMARTGKVAVSVADRADDYRTLWVQGTVEFIEDGADAHIDSLAKKYMGLDRYPLHRDDQTRVIVRVTPTKRVSMR